MPPPDDSVNGSATEFRICTECGEQYVVRAKHQVLCGKRACSKRRQRRHKHLRETPLSHRPEFKELEGKQVKQIVTDVVKDELRPIIREQLTEDVTRGIGELVGLLPTAIQQLKADMLQKDDPELAHKAATLVMRLTVQNSSVAPPSQEQVPAPMQVHFNVPRSDPGATPAELDPDPEGFTDALVVEEPERQCMECHNYKPADAFVGNSDRCEACDEALRKQVLERFGPPQAMRELG